MIVWKRCFPDYLLLNNFAYPAIFLNPLMAWLLCLTLKILEVPTLWQRCLQNKHIKNLKQWSNSLVVKMLIHNPGVPYSKPLGGSKVDSVFHPSEVDRVSGISGNLVAKSKLPPHSGSVALRQLNLFHKKETIKCKVKLL